MKLYKLIIEYIECKRSLGLRFQSQAVNLKAFCKALGDVDIKEVDSDSVRAYLYGSGSITLYWFCKYEALSGFYSYAINRDHVSFSPLPTTMPKKPTPFVAYIYTPDELRQLLKATDILEKSKFHVDAMTFRTLLFLLFNTGLRIGEALSLTLADVSLSNNLLTIHDSKFFKSRLVPIDPRLGLVLHNFAKKKHVTSEDKHSTIFVKPNGLALTRLCIELVFRKLCNYCGIRREGGARQQPRLHDIRHTFALSRLLEWYRNGEDVQRLLPHLATYLGHVCISSTQRYLKMTPELLHEASSLFEHYALSEAAYV